MRLSSTKSRVHILIEVIGWLGVITIVLAYALASFGQITTTETTYHWLNLVGAVAVIFHSVAKKDYQPAALNFIWALIAIFALSRI